MPPILIFSPWEGVKVTPSESLPAQMGGLGSKASRWGWLAGREWEGREGKGREQRGEKGREQRGEKGREAGRGERVTYDFNVAAGMVVVARRP